MYLIVGRIATIYYFIHFILIMKILGFKEKTIQLTEAAGKIAEQAYKEEAAKQADAQQKGDGANAKQADDNVVDADFNEVDDEPKEKTTKTKTK